LSTRKERKIGSVLVIGGGIGGIQASIDLADSGFKVYLVDKKPGIGGVISQLDTMFPTHDCRMCIVSPRLRGCLRFGLGGYSNVEILDSAEIQKVEGEAGDFKVTVKRLPRYVDPEKCTSCGECVHVCPAEIPSEFQQGLVKRKAIYRPNPQTSSFIIDKSICPSDCRECSKVCKPDAIVHDMQEEKIEVNVGAIILSSGFDTFSPHVRKEYGWEIYPNVITGLQFERILSGSGPYQGQMLRPSDKKSPRRIAWVQCVGSRDLKSDCHSYCSSVCCMYATKEAIIAKEDDPEIESTIFFMDMRAFGKDFDKYYERARKEYGIRYIRSMVSSVKQIQKTKNLKIKYIRNGREIVEEEFDLVVLSMGFGPSEKLKQLGNKLGLKLNRYGFCQTDAFSPVRTSRAGIYVCGATSEPKDIPETVVQASAAAAEASSLLSEVRGEIVEKKQYPPEIDVGGQRPRIGVFFHNCAMDNGGTVNIPKVVESTKGLPGVVYTEENLYTLSPDTREILKGKIGEHSLNRVVVASYSARTHEPFFQEAMREAGLNQYLLEMVNISGECSGVDAQEPEVATEKAKNLVRMAVAKATKLESLQRLRLSVIPRGLVVGGGVSGMSTALSLARQGFEVYLVEKEKELGGFIKNIHYTLEGKDTQEFLTDMRNQISNNRLIKVFTNSEPKEISGCIGSFKTTLASGEELEHGTIVVATGAQELKTDEYLYGKNKNVLTQIELEEKLTHKNSEISNLESVVMIQCVGSREEHRPYCSRVCCSEGVKNALKIKEISPETKVFILYRDMRTYGFKEDYYRDAREKGIIFARYDEHEKPEVVEDRGSLRVSVNDEVLGGKLILRPDLVVLSTATVPYQENESLAQMLKAPLNDEGFFLEAHMKLRPVEFSTRGIFLAGMAHGPKFIEEAIAQAQAAAKKACTIMSQSEIESEAIIAQTNERQCRGCGVCVSVCPNEAIHIDEEAKKARVTEILCQGCGSCAAACPSGAAQQRRFTPRQILSMIDAVV